MFAGLVFCFGLQLMASTIEAQEANVAPSWNSVTVGVADLDKALELWVGVFGFSKLATRDGEDAELAALWRILPSDIKRQALLGMPGSQYGRLHLVEFTEPGPPVREGAQAFDLCPKNLDIYAQDLPARVKEMQALGYTFRNAEPSEVTAPDGTRFREIHLPAHDELNVVLLELLAQENEFSEMEFSAKGFAGIGPLISIVGHAPTERDFYANVMGLDILNDNVLEGPEIERMIGLPPGSGLDVSIWGDDSELLGQIELIDYRGVQGNNLYPIAIPTQLGILHVSYQLKDLDAFKQKLHDAGINHSDREYRELIFGSGRFIRFRTPSGMNIEAFESAD
jgi:catechol 2,3-dioxygenase-like lactoylglutathione lyase family enzyme